MLGGGRDSSPPPAACRSADRASGAGRDAAVARQANLAAPEGPDAGDGAEQRALARRPTAPLISAASPGRMSSVDALDERRPPGSSRSTRSSASRLGRVRARRRTPLAGASVCTRASASLEADQAVHDRAATPRCRCTTLMMNDSESCTWPKADDGLHQAAELHLAGEVARRGDQEREDDRDLAVADGEPGQPLGAGA